MSDFGNTSLIVGLFGVTIAVAGTDIFQTVEVLGMALILTLLGAVGLIAAMAFDLGLVGTATEASQ